jgi:hypothetical protein
MKFVDPLPIDCSACGPRSEQRVKELFALRACCPRCSHVFEVEGRRLREVVDERVRFVTCAEIVLSIEDKLGFTTDDAELCERLRSLTLRDIARFIQRYLPQTPDVEQVAIRMVVDAAKIVFQDRNAVRARGLPALDAESLDEPFLDGLDPHRWDQ